MRPTVSVIIPFYNDPYIEQAIQSALKQIYSPIEIIVVDDGSTMYTDRIIPYKNYLNYLGKANGGTASALNHGIRMSSGTYIAWLSSDDMFYPSKIERQVAFMLERGSSISFSSFNSINAQGVVTQSDVTPRFANAIDLYRMLLNANPINGCTTMIHRSIFDRVGLFDESLPYTHDLDLWYRAILNGYPIHYLDEVLVAYRWHDDMGTRKHWEEIQKEVNITMSRYRYAMERYIGGLIHA